MTKRLAIEPLTTEGFAPFGEVLEAAGRSLSVNQNTARRFDDLALVDATREGGRPRVSLFRAEPRQSPIAIAMMERHPLGSQAFMPADNFPWLVLVASGDDIPDSVAMRCFMADGEQGINYRRGVWHHPLLALPGNADNLRNFWVLDRAPAPQESPAANLQECQLPSPCEIWL